MTVILGLLCLLLSDLSSLGLGPVGAIGIAGAMLSALTLLPAAAAPRPVGLLAVPADVRLGAQGRAGLGAGWRARRPAKCARTVWVMTFVGLALCAAFVPTLIEDPVPQTDTFLTDVDSVKAQEILDRSFPSDESSPVLVIAPEEDLQRVVDAVGNQDGSCRTRSPTCCMGPPTGLGAASTQGD